MIFKPAPGPLQNPLKGWCTYTDAGMVHQPYSLVFQYVSWRELEPREGEFAFSQWEQKWEIPAARDKHIVFRVYIDYPRQPSGLPEWVRAKGVKVTRYRGEGGGESPRYDHPAMLAGMERLIAALGQRYNSHPRIAFIQLGLLGFWGEWHTYTNPELFPGEATQRRVVDAYKKAFPDKKLMARYAKGYPGKQPWLGYHDDFFPEDTGDEGPEKDWHFLYGIHRSGRGENWKQAVIGGEMIPQAGNNALKWLGSEKQFAFTLRRAEEAHFSWIGPYSPALESPPSPEFVERSQKLVRRMGYQYRLVEIRCPETVERGKPWPFTLTGINEGVAPFYYRWPVHLALLDESDRVIEQFPLPDADLRTWLPGPFTFRAAAAFRRAPAGLYRLALGIIAPWTRKPSIAFANHLPTINGWTILTTLPVVFPSA